MKPDPAEPVTQGEPSAFKEHAIARQYAHALRPLLIGGNDVESRVASLIGAALDAHTASLAARLKEAEERAERAEAIIDNRDDGLLARDADLSAALASRDAAVRALTILRHDANRLCDRNLGGSYESDCRESIAKADLVLSKPEPPA